MIDTGEGGERLMAEVFALSEFGQSHGIVFADVGWPEATSHPFHIVPGRITEDEEGWRVGDRQVRIAFEGEQLNASWGLWQQWRSNAGKAFDRAACVEEIKLSGILDTAAAA